MHWVIFKSKYLEFACFRDQNLEHFKPWFDLCIKTIFREIKLLETFGQNPNDIY